MQESNIVSRKLDLSYQTYCDHKKNLAGMKIDGYQVIKLLGQGQFGSVYLAQNQQKIKYAVKVLDLKDIANETNVRVKAIRERLAVSEPKLMMLCSSPHLIKCFDIYENESLKILIMEFCAGLNLYEYLRKKKKIPEAEAVQILRQLISGIAELHKHNIVHRDLKTENIMEHQGQFKIIDFGFSKKLKIANQQEQIKNTLLGTPTTMAPEVFLRKDYGLKADIWSIGIIFFEMVFGVQPYDSSNARKFYNDIENQLKQRRPYGGVVISEVAFDFLSKTLKVNPDNRMGWRELFEHPLIKVKKDQPLPQKFVQRASLIMPQIPIKLQKQSLKNSMAFDVQSINETIVEQKKQQSPKIPSKPKKIDINAAILEQKQKQQKKAQQKKIQIDNNVRLNKRVEALKAQQLQQKRNEMIPFNKCLEMHLACLKTELIFNQIFTPIEVRNLFDLNSRMGIQFIHLLISRCFRNMSPLVQYMKRNHQNAPRTYHNLSDQISNLYLKVKVKFDYYDEMLRNKQNKLTEISKDFFSKIFHKKWNEMKNKFIGGVEIIPQYQFGDFTMKQQVEYTITYYIQQLLPKMAQMGDVSKKVRNYLLKYDQITLVQLSVLGEGTYRQYVDNLLRSM